MIFINFIQKEMKYQMKGIVFWLIIILTAFFLYTQFGLYSSSDFKPIRRNMQMTIKIEPAREIAYYSDELKKDLARNQISRYSIVKNEIIISDRAKEKMKSILDEIKVNERSYYDKYNTNLRELDQILGGSTIYSVKWRKNLFDTYLPPEEEMKKIRRHMQNDLKQNKTVKYNISKKEITLSEQTRTAIKDFLEYIGKREIGAEQYNSVITELYKINQLAGGNTIYGEKWQKIIIRDKLYYQRELKELNEKIDHGLTDSYGRLFSDYLGIAVGFFPIFIGAFLISRDRRTGMEELIRSRKVNSYLYIGGKIAGVFLLLAVFYLLLSLIPTFNFYQICQENGWNFQISGFIKYTAGWVLPTLLFVLSATAFISEFTGNSLVAVGVQLIWLFKSMMPLKGDYSLFKYIIRFNSPASFELYQNTAADIMINRFFYLGLSLVLIFITAKLWQEKDITEKGGYHVIGRIFKI